MLFKNSVLCYINIVATNIRNVIMCVQWICYKSVKYIQIIYWLQESPSGEGEKDERNSLNHTLDSDTLEEQLESEMELDSQTVEMIVMGPNQGAVSVV